MALPAVASAAAEIRIWSSTIAPQPVPAGSNLTYSLVVRNLGPDPATAVSVTFDLPEGPSPGPNATFVSLAAPAGWTCSTPAVGASGDVSCVANSALPVGDSAFTLVVNVPASTTPGNAIVTTITVASTNDIDATNNTAIETPTVSAPTAVSLLSFMATRSRAGVVLKWRTESELGTLGFNVYREANGRRVRVNRKLIAAKGRGAYSFLDRRAPRAKTIRYWIQEVAVDGSRTWYGPVRVRT